MVETPHPQVQQVLDLMSESAVAGLTGRGLAVESARATDKWPDQPTEPVGQVEEFKIEGPDRPIPVRLYQPEDGDDTDRPLVVYYHGGGFTLGDLDNADSTCRSLVNKASCVVVSVDYRLAPEHPFPAGFKDAYAAVSWASEQASVLDIDPERIAVAGDSAGGALAAGVSLAARDRDGPSIAHQFLIYPGVRSPVQPVTDSLEENSEGYLLEDDGMEWFIDQYIARPSDLRNEYAFPLLARDLSGLAPATVVTAGFDPLYDEGKRYADRLADAEVPVEHRNYEAMIHGFANMRGFVDAAEDLADYAGDRLATAFE